jgi:DNA-binding NarL/FixJ family response regulator
VEVARLLDEGLSNQQIALRLQLELPTVKHHVHHILHKLGVGSRGEAVARLRGLGLLAGCACAWLDLGVFDLGLI